MALDKNAKNVRDNAIGTVLCLMAFVLMVVVSVSGDDPVQPQHAVILFIDALGAAWFSCGVMTALRNRRGDL